MWNTFTKQDMTDQVVTSLDGDEDDYDVSGIVEDIVADYGVVDINTIHSFAYWDIVADNAL